MRKYVIPQSMALEYTLGDQLGSTSITTDANGAKVSEMRYKPWGEVRYSWSDPSLNTTPTYQLSDYTFTGQRSYSSDFGLMYYHARFYDPQLGRFTSADTIVPPGVQGYDRYAYVNNSPVNYTDPSGHESDPYGCNGNSECIRQHVDRGTYAPPPDGLTERGKTMYYYYQHLKANYYPNLTFPQFFGLMTMYEINGNPNAEPQIIDSAGDQLFPEDHDPSSPNPYCGDSTVDCYAGAFNYLGQYSQSAYGHATSHNDQPPPSLAGSTDDLLTDAQNIGSKILLESRGKHQTFEGIHYGNNLSWQDAARNRMSFGTGVNQVLTMDGSFVAYRLYQENFWTCVTNENYNTCARAYGIDPKK